jgi:PAS domain S-box-containing protein
VNTTKIMVVDDNAATRRMVRNALTRSGHEVIEAPDGRSALELMRREQPRIVLQDLMLPDTDGFKLVGELREIVPDCAFLAFSGFVSKLDDARASSVGFDDIIPKPIAPSRLVPLVEAHLPAPARADERFGVGRRLVVADDDPLQLKLALFRLTRLGFEVESAPDGQAALELIRQRAPDAVVSDVMMPNLDGFSLAMALRQDPQLARIPLVLVTASYIEPSDRELARRAGANDLVVRTPELVELIDLLRATLSGRAKPPAAASGAAFEELERERNRRVMRQLERQVMLNTGLAKRCSVLSSELTVLTGIAEAVLRHLDLDTALDESLAACFDAGGVSAGALYLLDPDDRLRVRMLGTGAAWQAPDDLLRGVIRSGRPLTVPSPEVPPDIAAQLLASCDGTALQVLPLASGARPLGALLMVSRGRELDPGDWRAFGQGLATQISQVMTLASAYADREAAEKRAAEHAALLEAVVTSAPDIIVQVAPDGTILYANGAVRGLPPAAIIGRSFFDLPPAGEAAGIRAIFERVLETGEPGGYETQGLGLDGTQSWYSVRLGPAKHEGRVVAVVVIARDITEKKRTEMQLMLSDRMASVGTLAAGVAHEINNPLAAVIANLDMAAHEIDALGKATPLPPDLREELNDARTSAERVRHIVRDLKIFSRAEEDARGPVDIEEVLESTLRMAWNELRHRARVVKSFTKVPRVDANESRLGQVFLNIIVNAAQAIAPGNYERNQIRIGTELVADHVVVSIADSGCGIPEDVRSRLFTPFFTTKPIGVGTGLGLAISHRIITGLGGTIDFDSHPGRGTEFRVMLPVATRDAQPVVARTATGESRGRRARVLVIDDEEALVLTMKRYLAVEHDVEAVTSARAALDLLLGGRRFDVILCDVMMPQITGMDFHTRVCALDASLAPRIVFVTGGAFTPTAREFLDRVPNRRLEKPFDLKSLRLVVNELLG